MSLDAPLHITVPRTARYYLLGTPGEAVRDVWIVCHGYGQLAAPFAEPLVSLVAATRLIVVPEALSRFYIDSTLPHTSASRIGASWMTREDREAEIADVVTYLDTLYARVLELLGEYDVSRDRVRVHALGFSQGVPAVSRWVARGSAVVDHVVVWGNSVPQDVDLRAVHERRPTLRLDVVYGLSDRFVTPAIVETQRAALDASGVSYALRTFPGGHVLSEPVLREFMGV